jgi:hypothetical protein
MTEFTKRRGDTWVFDLPLTRVDAQTITIEGTPTAGTFTIAYTSQDGRAETTYGIAHNANAAAVETALETLPNVTAGDVTVTGGPGPDVPWVVTINTVGAYVLAVTGTFTGGSGVNIHVDPTAFDLTGASVYATFKQNKALADDADGVFQYSWINGTPDGITVATPATGVAVRTITDTESATYLTNNPYYYDVQVTDAAGETVTVDDGTLRVTEDITRTVA